MKKNKLTLDEKMDKLERATTRLKKKVKESTDTEYKKAIDKMSKDDLANEVAKQATVTNKPQSTQSSTAKQDNEAKTKYAKDTFLKKFGKDDPAKSAEVDAKAGLTESTVDKIMAYEGGEMDDDEMIEFFQELYDTGTYRSLQGHYQRVMRSLIDDGFINTERKESTKRRKLTLSEAKVTVEKATKIIDRLSKVMDKLRNTSEIKSMMYDYASVCNSLGLDCSLENVIGDFISNSKELLKALDLDKETLDIAIKQMQKDSESKNKELAGIKESHLMDDIVDSEDDAIGYMYKGEAYCLECGDESMWNEAVRKDQVLTNLDSNSDLKCVSCDVPLVTDFDGNSDEYEVEDYPFNMSREDRDVADAHRERMSYSMDEKTKIKDAEEDDAVISKEPVSREKKPVKRFKKEGFLNKKEGLAEEEVLKQLDNLVASSFEPLVEENISYEVRVAFNESLEPQERKEILESIILLANDMDSTFSIKENIQNTLSIFSNVESSAIALENGIEHHFKDEITSLKISI